MKQYGDTEIQPSSLVVDPEASFPLSPPTGRMLFVDKRVWIFAEIVGTDPTWIPLTNEIDTYIHRQRVAATTWIVDHKLITGTPLVQVYDSTNKVVVPENIEVTSVDSVTITFDEPVVGRAVVMHDSIIGRDKPRYNYIHTQTTTNIVWKIPHDLGYYPIIRVFIADAEIQPFSIIHDNPNHTTITFSTPRVGIARLT